MNEAKRCVLRQNATNEAKCSVMRQNATNEAKRSVLRQNATNEAKRSVLRQNATNEAKRSVLRQNATNEAKRSVLRQNATNEAKRSVLRQNATNEAKRSVLRQNATNEAKRSTDDRNFDVHKPFAFGDFGISVLDELREIIPKKKNAVVKDLMNSLSRRYKRIRKIPKDLGVKSALPTPAYTPEQASSRSSRKKRKHMELKPEIRIPGLECNRALPENVPFVNNMVIKEPEYRIFFTDEFGDRAFQRWSDIGKEGMESLVSYLIAASMVQSTVECSTIEQ
ncbi:hypothetical protein Tco_0084080 [Tanacetum coccineum]